MMAPHDTVTEFLVRMQARDWAGAAELLAADVHVEFTATGEWFDGPNYLAMNEAYPEGWTIIVHEALSSGDRVAVQVSVDHDGQRFWCAGFYTVRDGVLAAGTEHWVTERSDPPPAWRARYTS